MLHLCNNSAIIRDIHSKMIYFTYYNSMPSQNQSDEHFVHSLGQKVNVLCSITVIILKPVILEV